LTALRPRDSLCDPDAQVGMKPAKQSDRDRRANDGLEETVAQVTATQPVAMCHQGGLAGDGRAERTVVELETDLLPQEAAAPCVVIAAGECDRNAGLDELGKRGEHPEVPARDDRPVLEPEIEQVTGDQQCAGFGRASLQKAEEATLGLIRHTTQVQIADDDVWLVHDAPKLRGRGAPASAPPDAARSRGDVGNRAGRDGAPGNDRPRAMQGAVGCGTLRRACWGPGRKGRMRGQRSADGHAGRPAGRPEVLRPCRGLYVTLRGPWLTLKYEGRSRVRPRPPRSSRATRAS